MPTSQNLSSPPLITFIVTTYNLSSELVTECLKSIMALSLSKEQRQIIVVDDGSDLPAISELTVFANDMTYVYQPNQGLSVARNTGLKLATGRFIQFVDGDDCLIQPQYEHCLDIIRYHEPVDMVLFYASQLKDHPVDLSFDGPMTGADFMQKHNVRASACGYIFRADRLGDLRFTAGIFHEDEEFTPRLLLRVHNLYTTNAPAYFYRQRNGSIIHNKQTRDKRLQDAFGVILRLKAISKSFSKDSEPEKSAALDRRVAQLSMDYLVNVARLTRSYKKLGEGIDTLAQHGLYPLPDNHYTKKYTLFRHLIKSKMGRMALIAFL